MLASYADRRGSEGRELWWYWSPHQAALRWDDERCQWVWPASSSAFLPVEPSLSTDTYNEASCHGKGTKTTTLRTFLGLP